jgi:ComF family protein
VDDYFRLCARCTRNIELIQGLMCKYCGKPLPDGGARCYSCRKKPLSHIESVRSAGEYRGLLRTWIHKFKYQNKDYCDRILGRLITYVLDKEKSCADVDAVVAVPMHWLKKFFRGYDQAELLAVKAAAHIGKPVLKKTLIRKRLTKPQFRLNVSERKANLRDSFAVRNPKNVKGKKILLVDDVATTCATLEQCALALKRSGARKIYAVTVARD